MGASPKAHTAPIPVERRPRQATLFNADKKPLDVAGLYAGRSVFLICGGPSFAALDHALLKQPGIVTMAINNSPKTFRPNLWTYVDPVCKWLRSIWLDPTITKFGCVRDAKKRIFNSDTWREMDVKVRECPNVFYYERNADRFDAKTYLTSSSFWWGQSGKTTDEYGQKGGRSVMLLAIRLCHYLGFRRVFLLGCDFKMDEQHQYHFDQNKHEGSIKGNNSTYETMQVWFSALRPVFEADGFNVYNCNLTSGLTAFDFVPYDKALEQVLDEWGNIDLANERTEGLYEREMLLKAEKEKKEPLKKYEGAKETVSRTKSARVRVRSPITGKRYTGKATATVEAEAVADGEARTRVGCEVAAYRKAFRLAWDKAEKQAEGQAKQEAQADAERRMREAEKGKTG